MNRFLPLTSLTAVIAVLLMASNLIAESPSVSKITGNYLEVRSCDVYTGPCFANAEMGLDGKEAMLVWSIGAGEWNDTNLAGLSVIAVVRTQDTLGDIKYAEPKGDTVLILDQRADSAQQAALASFAKSSAEKLIGRVVNTRTAKIDSNIGDCTKEGTCARVVAGDLVNITTRCLGDGDHVCGNEYRYYPPLTEVKNSVPAFTETFSYQGNELQMKWNTTGLRSAYVGSFALASPAFVADASVATF